MSRIPLLYLTEETNVLEYNFNTVDPLISNNDYTPLRKASKQLSLC
jgi:hypothetical protein